MWLFISENCKPHLTYSLKDLSPNMLLYMKIVPGVSNRSSPCHNTDWVIRFSQKPETSKTKKRKFLDERKDNQTM